MLDVFTGALDTKTVLVEDGLIHGFGSEPAKETFEAKGAVLLPSLIDSNVHIESPMLSPASFASLVLPFGTTTVTADPHEMTNVRHAGLVEACRDLPLVVKLMVPSCVPTLPFEDEGAFIDAGQTQALLDPPRVFSVLAK